MSIPTAEVVETSTVDGNLRWNLVGDGLRWQIWAMSLMTAGTILLFVFGLSVMGGTLKNSTVSQVLMVISSALIGIGLLALLPSHVLTAFAPEKPLTTTLSIASLFVLIYGLSQVASIAMLASRFPMGYGRSGGQNAMELAMASGGLTLVSASFCYGMLSVGALLSLATHTTEVDLVRRCSILLFLNFLIPIVQIALGFGLAAIPGMDQTTVSIISAVGMLLLTGGYLFAYLRATLPLLESLRRNYPASRKAAPPPFRPVAARVDPLPDPFAD